MATLTIHRENRLDRRVEIGTSPLRIGRAPENEIVLEDPKKGVSRFHAEIRPEPNGYRIVDLNSQNGVWLENRRVTEHVLEDSQPVRIGPFQITLETNTDQAEDANADAAAELQTREIQTGEVPIVPASVDSPPPAIPGTPAARTVNQRAHGQRRRPPAPLLILGVVVIGIAGVGAVVALRSRRPAQAPPPEPVTQITEIANRPVQPPDPPPLPDPPKPPEPPGPAEHQAALLASATAFLSLNQLEETRQAQAMVDEVLASDPGNTEAAQLKTRIRDQLRRLPGGRGTPPAPTTPSWPEGLPAVRAREGEAQPMTVARARALYTNYENARDKLNAGDFAAAIFGFEQILKDEPGYQDSADLLADARRKEVQRARDASTRHLADGRRLQGELDLLGARREFVAALDEDSGNAEARTALDAVNRRMVLEGEDAVRNAITAESYGRTQAESYGRTQSVRDLYQKGVNYLPQDNVLRKSAEERLLALPRD